MSMLTMKTIMQTFSEMIEEMPFDKITVLALVKRCEINHNTFYYHFQDFTIIRHLFFLLSRISIRYYYNKTQVVFIIYPDCLNCPKTDNLKNLSKMQNQNSLFTLYYSVIIDIVPLKKYTEGVYTVLFENNLEEEWTFKDGHWEFVA